MHKSMQTIETAPRIAARIAIAGAYEPAQQESAMLRTGFYVTTACILVGALILLMA